MRMNMLAAATALGLAALQQASAAVVVEALETGGDVTFTVSGTLDITGADAVFPFPLENPDTAIDPSNGFFATPAPANHTFVEISLTASTGIGGNNNGFGTGGFQVAASSTGVFGMFDANLSGSALVLPVGFTSGDAVSATMLFSGTDFLTMGLTPGTYTYSLPSDSITVQVGPTVVPGPATLPLLGTVLGGLFIVRRRRRRA